MLVNFCQTTGCHIPEDMDTTEHLIFHKFHGVCQHTLSRRDKGWDTLINATRSVFATENEALIHVKNQKTALQQKTVSLTQTVLCQLEPNPQAVSESESNTASAELVLGSLGGVLGVLWLMAKSCARFDLLFLIGANFGGGIMCLSTWNSIKSTHKLYKTMVTRLKCLENNTRMTKVTANVFSEVNSKNYTQRSNWSED